MYFVTLMGFHEIICNQYYRFFFTYGVLRFQSEKEKYLNQKKLFFQIRRRKIEEQQNKNKNKNQLRQKKLINLCPLISPKQFCFNQVKIVLDMSKVVLKCGHVTNSKIQSQNKFSDLIQIKNLFCLFQGQRVGVGAVMRSLCLTNRIHICREIKNLFWPGPKQLYPKSKVAMI